MAFKMTLTSMRCRTVIHGLLCGGIPRQCAATVDKGMSNWTNIMGEKTNQENLKREQKDKKPRLQKDNSWGKRNDPVNMIQNQNAEHFQQEIKMPSIKDIFNQPESADDAKKIPLQEFLSSDVECDAEMASQQNNVGGDSKIRANKVNNSTVSKKNQGKSREAWLETAYMDLIQNPSLAADWKQFGQQFSNSHFLNNKWPCILLYYIAHKEEHVDGLFEIGMSLADFVQTTSDRNVVLRLVSLISLYLNHGGERSFDAAYAYYDELCSVTDVLDYSSALLLILAFSKTPRWRNCLDFLEMTKVSATPSSAHYGPIIKAALQANEIQLADTLFSEMFAGGIVPSDDVFERMVELGMVLKVLEVLEKFRWIPSETVALHIQDYFFSLKPKENWKGQFTKIDQRSVCKACSAAVDRLPTLSEVDFDRLRDVFMTKAVLRDGNTFLNTSPEEVKSFHEFLSRHGSFDVIVDGLNVAYRTHQKATERERDNVLLQVLQYLVNGSSKVLVLSRSHMQGWKSAGLHQNPKGGHIEWFFANNLSADDPFMLYAALHSGQKALIITNDELRDHRFLLGPELAGLLKVWQRGHQVLFLGLMKQFGKFSPKFKWPDKHDTRVQKNVKGNSWHIPFDNGSDRSSFQLPDNWICLHRT